MSERSEIEAAAERMRGSKAGTYKYGAPIFVPLQLISRQYLDDVATLSEAYLEDHTDDGEPSEQFEMAVRDCLEAYRRGRNDLEGLLFRFFDPSRQHYLICRIRSFVADFYPQTNHERRMEHFEAECQELRDATTREQRIEEAADCALILFHMIIAENADPLAEMSLKLALARKRIESGEKSPRPFKD